DVPRSTLSPARKRFRFGERTQSPHRRSSHHSIAIVIETKTTSGKAAEKSGGQSLRTPRFENSRPVRKNERPRIVPANIRKPTPPWRRWKYENGNATIIITSTAAG